MAGRVGAVAHGAEARLRTEAEAASRRAPGTAEITCMGSSSRTTKMTRRRKYKPRIADYEYIRSPNRDMKLVVDYYCVCTVLLRTISIVVQCLLSILL